MSKIEDRCIHHDWEAAHDLLDKHGVLWTPEHEIGAHLLNRIEAAMKVWDAIGELSARVCHDTRFLCNTAPEVVAAIEAHRAAYRCPTQQPPAALCPEVP